MHDPSRQDVLLPVHPPSRGPAALERFLAIGEEAVSTQELLELLLLSGRRVRSPRRLAAYLLERFEGLRRLAGSRPGELHAHAGLGRIEAVRLGAAFALGRRALAMRLETGRLLRTSREVFEAFHGRLRDLRKERFLSVLIDARQRVMREDIVSEGTLTASLVHPREVFAPAIREAAGGVLLVHNHPSGDPEPSAEDAEITRRLVAAGEIVGIRVHDHVVIGDGAYVSFRERGWI